MRRKRLVCRAPRLQLSRKVKTKIETFLKSAKGQSKEFISKKSNMPPPCEGEFTLVKREQAKKEYHQSAL